MRHDHLGLIPADRRARTRAGVVVATLVAAATPVVAGSAAAFHDAVPPRTASLAAAVFAPSSAGVVVASLVTGGVALSWTVSVAGAATVTYRVQRSDDLGGTVAVCAGASAAVVTSGTAGCVDSTAQPGRTYRYVQQPVLVRNGVDTWSQPPSAPSSPISVPAVVIGPRFVFASVSAAVTSTKSGPVSLSYPAGTAPGDLLVLVSFGGRSSLPTLPIGWSEAASVSTRGSDASHLFVVWRAADSSGSVSFDAQSNSAGTVTRLLRYARATGVTDPPSLAGPTASGVASTGATATSAGVATTAASATVVEFAAIREATAIRLVSSSLGVRVAESVAPGRVALAVGVADGFAPSVGQTTGASWQQDGSAAEWLWASVAFR